MRSRGSRVKVGASEARGASGVDEIDDPEETSPEERARRSSRSLLIEGRQRISCFLLAPSPSRWESTGDESRDRLGDTRVACAWEASTAWERGADSTSGMELNSITVEATSVDPALLDASAVEVSERKEVGQHQEEVGTREEFSWALAIHAASMREVVCQEATQVSTMAGCPGRKKGLEVSW